MFWFFYFLWTDKFPAGPGKSFSGAPGNCQHLQVFVLAASWRKKTAEVAPDNNAAAKGNLYPPQHGDSQPCLLGGHWQGEMSQDMQGCRSWSQ